MEELYLKLSRQGYSKQQIEHIFRLLYHFLEENYPVLAALSEKMICDYMDSSYTEAA